jgi:hypothetical protein
MPLFIKLKQENIPIGFFISDALWQYFPIMIIGDGKTRGAVRV